MGAASHIPLPRELAWQKGGNMARAIIILREDRMKKGILACLMMMFVCAGHAFAEEELAPGFNACIDGSNGVTSNMTECYSAATNYWDKILNANYKSAMRDCANTEHANECKANLLKAQRLWIQYRDAMIPVIIDVGGGGSISRLAADDFYARETKKQAKLLAPDQ